MLSVSIFLGALVLPIQLIELSRESVQDGTWDLRGLVVVSCSWLIESNAA